MVLGLLVVRLVEVVSGALVHVAATAVEHVVGLGHTIELSGGSAGDCSF